MTAADRTAPRRPAGPAAARGRRGRALLRGGLVLGLLVLAGAAALLAVRLSLGVDAARRDLVAALSAAAEGPVAIRGQVALALLPSPRLVAEGLSVEPAGGGRLDVPRLTAELDILPALSGRAEIRRLLLDSPRLREAPGEDAAAQPLDALLPAQAALARLGSAGAIEIRDGAVLGPDDRPRLSQVELQLSADRFSNGRSLSGSLVWRGERVLLDAAAGTGADGARHLALSLASPRLSLDIDGTLGAADAAFRGEASLSAPSLPRAAEWLGHQGPALPEFGPVSLAGTLAVAGGEATLSPAEVLLAGSRGEGALVLLGGLEGPARPRLDGTLAFASLDLSALADALAPPPAGPAGLGRPIPTGFLALLDLDLRVSAEAAQAGPAPVEDLAATLHIERGVATLDLGDATVADGRASARLVVDSLASRPVVRGAFSLRGFDLAALGRLAGAPEESLSGRATIEGMLEAPLADWLDLTRDVRVDALVTAAKAGVGLAALAPGREAAATPLLAAGAGRLEDATLSARLRLEGPRLGIEDLDLAAPGGRLRLGGLLAGAGGRVWLNGRFEPEPAEDPTAPSVWGPTGPSDIELSGAWPAPRLALRPLPAAGASAP